MVTDLSGVLQEQRVVPVVDKKGKTVGTEKRPLFTVDEKGSISVESMKGTKYYSYAQECDSEIKNGWLQCSEIRKFLSKFKDNDVKTDTYDLMYYQEKNDKGIVTKICTLVKNTNANYADEQTVFHFDDNGNVLRKILYETPGMKFEGTSIYDGSTGYATHCNENGDTLVHRPMQEQNYKRLELLSERIKNQKETGFSKFMKWIKSLF